MNVIVYSDREHLLKALSYISDEELEEVKKAIYHLTNYEKYISVRNICFENAFELSEFCERLSKPLPDAFSIVRSEEIVLQTKLSRLIVNFLSTYYNFLEFSKSHAKKWLGEEAFVKTKSVISDFYDSGLTYKFFIKLRNHITHCGLPVHLTILYEKDGQRFLKFILMSETLLEYDSWGIDLKKFLQSDESDVEINLVTIFSVCATAVAILAKELQEYYLKQILSAKKLMLKLLDNVKYSDYSFQLWIYCADVLCTPIKLTTSCRGKLTTYFAGEDFAFMHVS